ncbi:MAG TPA: alginate lyase family protein, partial [Albitalea sp.]
MAGDLKVFGQSVPMREGIPDWNRDPVTGRSIPLDFGLFIDFRHIGGGVDIKHLWEVNRHLWWVTIAQAWALTGRQAYLARLGALIDDWVRACPYGRGANWASPVEHGIRLINWSIVWQLIGGERCDLWQGQSGRERLQRWYACIFQHMRFASDNYSRYSSADNHLIGEAAGVFVAGHVWDCWAQARQLRRRAKRILETETLRQFAPDGVNREQALCYHEFSLQFLLAAGLCARAAEDDFAPATWGRIEAALTFLAAMVDGQGRLPAIGDADDGRVWALGASDAHRFLLALGAALFSRDDLHAKAQAGRAQPDAPLSWIAGVAPHVPVDAGAVRRLPTRFEQGGYVLLGHDLHDPDELRVLFDCGSLGYNRIAGHGHADALSVLLTWAGREWLVDAGTYCYNAAPQLRRYFRGTSAHNTLVVDDQDQSEYGASFLWLRDVNCALIPENGATGRRVHATHDGYLRLSDPVMHHRRVTLDGRTLLVEDWLECAQPHDVMLHWHAGVGIALQREGADWALRADGHTVRLRLEGAEFQAGVIEGCEDPVQGWVSPRFYERAAAPVLVARARLSPRQ